MDAISASEAVVARDPMKQEMKLYNRPTGPPFTGA